MDQQQPLEQQLQAAREEAELTLEQLHLFQQELELYFVRSQDLEAKLKESVNTSDQVEELIKQRDGAIADRDKLKIAYEKTGKELKDSQRRIQELARELDAAIVDRDKHKTAAEKGNEAVKDAEQNADLLKTAQRMLDGQARYLEDLSLKEEDAAKAIDELRLLKKEIYYYIQFSKPSRNLDPSRIQRLVDLVKTLVP